MLWSLFKNLLLIVLSFPNNWHCYAIQVLVSRSARPNSVGLGNTGGQRVTPKPLSPPPPNPLLAQWKPWPLGSATIFLISTLLSLIYLLVVEVWIELRPTWQAHTLCCCQTGSFLQWHAAAVPNANFRIIAVIVGNSSFCSWIAEGFDPQSPPLLPRTPHPHSAPLSWTPPFSFHWGVNARRLLRIQQVIQRSDHVTCVFLSLFIIVVE